MLDRAMDVLQQALDEIRAKAAELRESFADESRARALEWAVARMERALVERDGEALTLAQAARRSGYTAGHLARLIRAGRLLSIGRRGAPRVRAGDLPIRAARRVAPLHRLGYDPIADARTLSSRRGGRQT
ncbi:MAG: hypothetical protein HOQ09_06090 [Gemmatimonadaceae bacterium]|nr:hypothetical protein [Gemmatimonadaceae bacterium]